MRTFGRKLSQSQLSAGLSLQAAAICYRAGGAALEFLLVKTSSGKWTFPKGRIEPALTASESAAREAWEEAGARGHIEDEHFAVYLDTKRTLGHDSNTREIIIAAFLFEVHSAVPPEELHRNPTWFAPEEARKRLQEARTPRYASQISSVIDAALERLSRKKMLPLPPLISSTRRTRITPFR
jgi:8-oxo-dGTP pyrophosphatase MutT (NUDIX family)